MSLIIDVDQHLYEPADMWREYIDPADRELALTIEPDAAGYWWVTSPLLGQRITYASLGVPGDGFMAIHTPAVRRRQGLPSEVDYARDIPEDYWNPSARVAKLDEFGIDRAVMLPNWGFVWPHGVADRVDVIRANMAAWNRWAVEVRQQGGGRLEPVGHVTLRGGDLTWLEDQLRYLGSHGIKAATLSYGITDGRRPSDPDHDRAWAAFLEHGVTPLFHILDADVRPSQLDEAWFANDDPLLSVLEMSFAHVGIQVTIADLVLNGVFDRFPDLRVCCVELTAGWIPALTQGSARSEGLVGFAINGPGLDIAYGLAAHMTGRHLLELKRAPSDYVLDHVVAAVNPAEPVHDYLAAGMEDVIAFGGDYPHSEGLLSPYREFSERVGPLSDAHAAKLYGGNVAGVLGIS